MYRRTTDIYVTIFRRLIELVSNLVQNVRFTISDYESALINAFRACFPRAHLTGCWFHFSQVLMETNYSSDLSSVMRIMQLFVFFLLICKLYADVGAGCIYLMKKNIFYQWLWQLFCYHQTYFRKHLISCKLKQIKSL